MSIYYSTKLVQLLMEERLREIRQDALVHCCEEPAAEEPKRSILSLFRRPQSPASCAC